MSCWGNYYRFIVLFVGFFCLSSVCSNYIIINFTFICMRDDMSQTRVINNTVRSVYDYTTEEKKYIMWSVGAGTVLGTVPTNWFVVKFGAKYPFLIAGLVSLTSTAFIPYAAGNSLVLVLFLRFLQGLAYSTDFAAIGIMTVRWAPLRETALFIATLTCFTGVSSMITNAATGLICQSSLGWQYAFYLHSFVGALFFTAWAWLYVDDPQDTKRISQRELSRIHKNKSAAHLEKNTNIPYLKIFTSPVVLIIWLNAFFEMSAVILFTTYMPIYFHQVLGFSVAETGFYVAFVLGFNIPLRMVAAAFSDRITVVSEKWKIIFFNTMSVGVSGLLLAMVGFIPAENKIQIFALFLSVMLCIALNCGGFYKCAALYTRQHAHVVIAAIQFTKCLALFSAPALVAFFVSTESNRSEWIPVYATLGISMFLANLISTFVFTDTPADWTEPDKKVYVEVPAEETKC